jgi:hypothetical protein
MTRLGRMSLCCKSGLVLAAGWGCFVVAGLFQFNIGSMNGAWPKAPTRCDIGRRPAEKQYAICRIALRIATKSPEPTARTCSEEPDPKGNAQDSRRNVGSLSVLPGRGCRRVGRPIHCTNKDNPGRARGLWRVWSPSPPEIHRRPLRVRRPCGRHCTSRVFRP